LYDDRNSDWNTVANPFFYYTGSVTLITIFGVPALMTLRVCRVIRVTFEALAMLPASTFGVVFAPFRFSFADFTVLRHWLAHSYSSSETLIRDREYALVGQDDILRRVVNPPCVCTDLSAHRGAVGTAATINGCVVG
jgi:hypothetical protein